MQSSPSKNRRFLSSAPHVASTEVNAPKTQVSSGDAGYDLLPPTSYVTTRASTVVVAAWYGVLGTRGLFSPI